MKGIVEMEDRNDATLYRVAIVEDDEQDAKQLRQLLERYAEEKGLNIVIDTYQNAVVFLTNYQARFDVIFMDIEMPYINGMEGACKLREIDKATLLIFTTNLGHMAVKGYEVEAFDFVVKPLHYESLRLKLNRTVARLALQAGEKIIFTSEGAKICLNTASLYYVEVSDHQLIYHTEEGDYPAYGTMTKVRAQLEPFGFCLYNNCYLVNLRHVRQVRNHIVLVGNTELQISHPRRKTFLEALNNYIGG